jgi:hypothetical protein
MSDADPFYRAGRKLPVRQPQPGERVRSMQVGAVSWSCELRYNGGGFGVEAQILRDGELVIGRRFNTRALALQWADMEREVLQAVDAGN